MDGVRPTKEYAGFHEVVRMTCLDTCKGVLAPRICIPLDYPYGKLDHLSADIGRLEIDLQSPMKNVQLLPPSRER